MFQCFIKITNRFRNGKRRKTKTVSEFYAATAELFKDRKDLLEGLNKLWNLFRASPEGDIAASVAVPKRSKRCRRRRKNNASNVDAE